MKIKNLAIMKKHQFTLQQFETHDSLFLIFNEKCIAVTLKDINWNIFVPDETSMLEDILTKNWIATLDKTEYATREQRPIEFFEQQLEGIK